MSTLQPGEKRLIIDGFTFYYMSANDSHTPDRRAGVEDDTARSIAEQFIEDCGGSPEGSAAAIVAYAKQGRIKRNTAHGSAYFDVKRKGTYQAIFTISH